MQRPEGRCSHESSVSAPSLSFSLPSSTHISIRKSPASTFLPGIVRTPSSSPTYPFPFPPPPSFRAGIQGCGCPIGGSASSLNSTTSENVQLSGMAFKEENRVDRRTKMARNCSSRSVVEMLRSAKEVRCSVRGIRGKEAVENTKRSRGMEAGERMTREVVAR